MSLGSFRLSHGRRRKSRSVAEQAINQPIVEPVLVAGMGAVSGVTPTQVAAWTGEPTPNVTVHGDETNPADAVTPIVVDADGGMRQGETVQTNPTPQQSYRSVQQNQGRNPNRR